MTESVADRIIQARYPLVAELPTFSRTSEAAEGGCGVLGFASTVPIAGRHVLTASAQMHNRGNGKGGGIAMAGLDAAQMRVDTDTLRTHYLLQIAFMDAEARPEVEARFITPYFEVAQSYEIDHVADYQAIEGLELRPPDVWRYFVRVKPAVLEQFAQTSGLLDLASRAVEDEFVYQNSFRLNQQFYASLGEKRAFILSHGRNLIVLKIVGYAEQVVEYYQLHDQVARVWIAHQRYPTKGRVWHPGGAHPFVGLNEALVHNGDFANYHAVSEYLRQRNIVPLFLTDTEVSALLFDLWDRVYQYPLEVTLEAMAPTTEHDFAMLPPDKQTLYRAIQATHIHASPDGPWFFIVARSRPDDGRTELLGITDTSMLRPQVFALYENSGKGQVAGNDQLIQNPKSKIQNRLGEATVQIGLIASERQAINACLRSLAAEDERFQPLADKYWVARGGSHTDGGAFHFSVSADNQLVCANKFAELVQVAGGRRHVNYATLEPERATAAFRQEWQEYAYHASDDGGAPTFWRWLAPQMAGLEWNELAWGLAWLRRFGGQGRAEWNFSWQTHNLLRDRLVDAGGKKRASLLGLVDKSLVELFDGVPGLKTYGVSG
ncbi:MAG: glutamate synthase, partial [Chloroflexota bacterium]